MTKTQLFRKIIREEVQKAIREEMPAILKELKAPSTTTKSAIKERLEDNFGVPLTLNTKPAALQQPIFNTSNPISSLMNETFISMTSDDVNSFGSGNVMPFQPNEISVGGVDEMLSTARKSSNLDAVVVNTVPDFSNLMDSMLSRGLIK